MASRSWPSPPFGDMVSDPAAWAARWKELGADLVCLKLRSLDPEGKNASTEDAVRTVKSVLQAVDLTPHRVWLRQ